MLWAGDYYAATRTLRSVQEQYGGLIERALEYKTELNKKRRHLTPEVRMHLQTEEMR